MNVEELIVRLRIEEDNRRSEKRGSFQSEVKNLYYCRPCPNGPWVKTGHFYLGQLLVSLTQPYASCGLK